MKVTAFKKFEADEIIGQINTGLSHIENPFVVNEPTKDFKQGALLQVKEHFKKTDIIIDIHEENGFTEIRAEQK